MPPASGPAPDFPRLLEPWPLAGRRAPNRVLFGPHETNLGRRRSISERHVAYYRRRAVGGCGTVVVETASVHPSDWPAERAPLAAECAEGWVAVARTLHEEGAVVLASLGHAGGQGQSAYSQAALWAPSRFPDPATREVPQEMEPEDIAVVVSGFATAAKLAVSCGLDGVEVNAGQLSLIRQFLSGLTNTRDDEYGVDRLRFAREVLAATRTALGEGPVLGLRLAADELAPWAGITPDVASEAARALACDGPRVDYVVAVRAPAFDVGGTRPVGRTPPGFALPLAEALRRALPPEVAVVAQGSVVDPEMAEAALAEGRADAVEMTRAQIAEPDLVVKLRAGEAKRVRPCVLCNQRCTVRDARNPIVSCIGEPSSGHEDEDPDWSTPRRGSALHLLVVGAGPAGLEAARLAAARGHRVTVREADRRAGGALRTAAAGTGRERLARLADWLEAECRRLGATIALETPVEEADLAAHLEAGGAVVVASGARPAAPRYGDDGSVVRLSAGALLRRVADEGLGAVPEGPVVVDDPVGDAVGVSVAELLAGAGRTVALVTGDLVAGTQLSLTGDLAPANARLARVGVRVVKGSVVTELLDKTVRLENRYTGRLEELAAAVLVEAAAAWPEDSLAAERPGLVVAGDAVAPRTVYEAILEGRRAVLALEEAR